MYKIVIFAAFLAIAQANTNVQKCRYNAGDLPISTTIEGCTNPPCQLPQLEDAVIHMSFVAPRNLNNLRTLAMAYLNLGNFVFPVPYELGAAANTCNFLTDASCPVDQDTLVNYTLRFMVDANFPIGVAATVEFRIVDSDALFCIGVPMQIVGPRGIAAEYTVINPVQPIHVVNDVLEQA